MIAAGLFLLLAVSDATAAQSPESATEVSKSAEPAKPPTRRAADIVDDDRPPELQMATKLARIRRIYVDILTGGESALQIRDLLMSGIQASKLFIVTEDEDKADATLKGAGRDEVFTDVHQSSDNVNAHTQLSIPTGNRNTTNQRYSDRTNTGFSVGENESSKIEERKHEARATVRLVNKDGDVIWSATEESLGAKFAGASVDVVERITRKLAADYRKAKAQAVPHS